MTKIQYEIIGLPEDALQKIDGFEFETRIFTYVHDPADHAHFAKVIPLIQPALRFNYFVYVLPVHVGAGLIAFAVVEQLYALFA